MLIDTLKGITKTLDQAIKELENAPEKSYIIELIDYCSSLDDMFKQFCEQVDYEVGENSNSYETGQNIDLEFYIDGSFMYQLSKILRKFKTKESHETEKS